MKPPPHPELMGYVIKKLETKGYMGPREVESVAARLRLPTSSVYGFVSQFAELPMHKRRARIRVCTGPACADAGAWGILEKLKKIVPGDVEVLAEAGIARWHRSPAACIEMRGEGTRLAQGLTPDDVDGLTRIIDDGDVSVYDPLLASMPPPIELLPDKGSSPLSAAIEESGMPRAGWAEALRRVSENPEEAKLVAGKCGINAGSERTRTHDGGRARTILVCDAAGPEPENSVDLAVSLLYPREVVVGAAMAAAACGARKVVFYLPLDDAGCVGVLQDAIDEELTGSGVRASVVRGPAQIPCAWDIGRAAILQGMMLWRAASLYGWDGTAAGDPSLAVLSAERAWRLPRSVEGRAAEGGELPGGRLICLAGYGKGPRLIEIPDGVGLGDIPGRLEPELGDDGPKALHTAGTTATVCDLHKAPGVSIEGIREVVMLDPLTCIPRWALYLALHAERACCGGCAPGRTVPAAAARLIQGMLMGESGEGDLAKLESLLAGSGELALCPHLGEILSPILACLLNFRAEFEAHATGGTCVAGSCVREVGVAT